MNYPAVTIFIVLLPVSVCLSVNTCYSPAKYLLLVSHWFIMLRLKPRFVLIGWFHAGNFSRYQNCVGGRQNSENFGATFSRLPLSPNRLFTHFVSLHGLFVLLVIS